MFAGLFYLGVMVTHIAVHFKALRPPVSDAQVRLAVASNCLLLAAFLLQLDFGDDYAWMTLTHFVQRYFFAHPRNELFVHYFSFETIALVDTVLFVPTAVTWVLMLRQRARPTQSPSRGATAANLPNPSLNRTGRYADSCSRASARPAGWPMHQALEVQRGERDEQRTGGT